MIRKAVPAALVAALTLAAPPAHADKIPGKDFAKGIKSDVSRIAGVRARSVKCPKTINTRKGKTYRCDARFSSGDKARIRVRFVDRRGGFRLDLMDMLLRHLETQLERRVPENHKGATVTCPARRTVKKNDTFRCLAEREGAQVGYFDLTQIGGARVRFSYLEGAPPAA